MILLALLALALAGIAVAALLRVLTLSRTRVATHLDDVGAYGYAADVPALSTEEPVERSTLSDIKAEFNSTKHTRGILSTARTPDPDSAGSQFFIMHGTTPSLDNKYTVFGKVIDGIKNAEIIMTAPTETGSERPADKVVIKSVTLQPRASKPRPSDRALPLSITNGLNATVRV